MMTVAAIIEAATQILQSDGEEGLTTNRIAERAGVSIGSLYQYFADKEAIIEAIAERERDQIIASVLRSLSEREPTDLESRVRDVIRTIISAFARRKRARRIVIVSMLRRWQTSSEKQGSDVVAQFMVEGAGRNKDARQRQTTPVSAFVLTRALMGPIRAAVIEDSPFLESQEFEDELVRLVLAFIRE
jgi:AcrR family transcriptional regulator